MLHEDFVDHFWNLAPQLLARTDLDDAAIGRAIADQCHLQGYQSGKTKVCLFGLTPDAVYHLMEWPSLETLNFNIASQ